MRDACNRIKQIGARIVRNNFTLLIVRLLLGSILVVAALGKLPDQVRFVEVVNSYGLLPPIMAEIYGWSLPWVEIIAGTGLIAGLLARYFAGISFLMIISFIIANGTAVYEKIFCPCFGGEAGLIKTSDALGILGIDRFYKGEVLWGILKLISGGGFFIWYIVDICLHAYRLGTTGQWTKGEVSSIQA